MIDIRLLDRSQPDPVTGKTYLQEYSDAIQNRKGDASVVSQLVELNRERRRLISEQEAIKAEQNKITQVIAQKKRNKEDASADVDQSQQLGSQAKELETQATQAEAKVTALLLTLPN